MNAFAAATNNSAAPWTTDRWKLVWEESRRAENYPISRWFLRPLAGLVARRLTHSNVRPWQVTLAGFGCTLLASASLAVLPTPSAFVCLLILAAWFCDRLDGQLARRQGTATRFGAWLDANLDELADLTLHTAFAYAASFRWGNVAWLMWGAFVVGKYLFMYGLAFEESEAPAESIAEPSEQSLLRRCYHWPANADVRIHLAAAAAFCGWLEVELAFIAVYYQVRWIARYVLVARRLRGEVA
jgi:phosphatidylglycerophosphate synthase